MKLRIFVSTIILALAFSVAVVAAAKSGGKDNDKDTATVAVPVTHSTAQDDPLRLEGERRYHANCGRCHMAPPKFAPRMMATIIRHMRVRATITDEEMRSILHYMTR